MTDSSAIVHSVHFPFAQIESIFNPSHSRTGIHDPSARVAAISTIDKFVRSLLTRRNVLVPISLLPPDILARVFHLLVFEKLPLAGIRNLDWIRVTHVCRHWRQVALDDLSLWTEIGGIPMNAKWISEMLVRAKNAPLDIDLIAHARPIHEALLMMPPHLSHTRQLRLHNLSPSHSDSVQKIYSSEAPFLEHFELTNATFPPITLLDLGGKMLFKGHTPRLQTFSHSFVVIPWSLIPRGQLTQLKITFLTGDVHSAGDLNLNQLDDLIDLLVNCPALEILALNSCLPSQLAKFPHGRTIDLPHLSRLRLCDSTSHVMN